MKFADSICGCEPLEIRNLIRTFLASLVEMRNAGGGFGVGGKRMDAAFVASAMNISEHDAMGVLTCLVECGWVDLRGVPTALGMALSARDSSAENRGSCHPGGSAP